MPSPDPGFDDSNWAPFNAETDSLHDLFPRERPQFIWYRLHSKVSPIDKDLALLENGISGVSELFCNGTLFLRVGQVSPLVSPNAFPDEDIRDTALDQRSNNNGQDEHACRP